MLATSAEPHQLVLDAGPLISVMYRRDRQHSTALAGFRQLDETGTKLLAPLPVVFEVYKWLLHETHPGAAYTGLARMQRTLEILYPEPGDLGEVVWLLRSMPAWRGSLEDALVVITALRRAVPVWTHNYRDFGAIRGLQFWTPAAR